MARKLPAQVKQSELFFTKKTDALAQFVSLVNDELVGTQENRVTAILVINMHRSDRIHSLLETPYSKVALQCLEDVIATCLRNQDRFVFVSENECWILLPQLASEALAILAVHRLLATLNEPINIDSQTIYLHTNIGISYAKNQENNANQLISMADEAQKIATLNHLQFSLANISFDKQSVSEERLNQLRAELEENSLEVRYQPKVELQTRQVVSLEALVRWPSAHEQEIETELLIDIAEEFGFIEQLTKQVMNKVLQDILHWKKKGIHVFVWVNLSAHLFSLEHLPQMLMRILDVWNIPTSAIGFEITESAFIQDVEKTTALLYQLKKCGFKLSIDDFGTGYSSLAYLRRFPIDEIKIDKMFIQGISTSNQDKQIVQSIINLGHNFGLTVVAEGVEDEITLEILEQMECNCIQGFYFAQPMQGDETGSWLKKNENGIVSQ